MPGGDRSLGCAGRRPEFRFAHVLIGTDVKVDFPAIMVDEVVTLSADKTQVVDVGAATV